MLEMSGWRRNIATQDTYNAPVICKDADTAVVFLNNNKGLES